MKIYFKHKGDFNKTTELLGRMKDGVDIEILEYYAQMGVKILSENTPKDTGTTSNKWSYSIEQNLERTETTISWHNSNIKDGYNVAILLQYGHGTNYGAYVKGIDYINPSLIPIFENMANKAWDEVTNK